MKKMLCALICSISSVAMAQTADIAGQLYDRVAQKDHKIVAELSSLAKHKDSQALAVLGLIHEYGILVPKNASTATRYYQQLCEQNDRYDCHIWHKYEDGTPIKKNQQQLAQIFTKIKTDEVNKLYDRLEQGDQHALTMLHLLAKRGNPQSLAMLGFTHEYGIAMPRNIPEAIRYYLQACSASGGKYGCYNAWYFYQYGVGVMQDKQRAAQILNKIPQDTINKTATQYFADDIKTIFAEKAASETDTSRRSDLLMYLSRYLYNMNDETQAIFDRLGFGQQDALRLARAWSKEGDARLLFLVGRFYNARFSYLDNQHKDQEAFKWFQRAAETGDASAQNVLGSVFQEGTWVKQDLQAAMQWFAKAAAQEEHDAIVNLGRIFYQGELVPVDYAQAFALFEQADKQDYSSRAASFLSKMYYNGQFVKADCDKAYLYSIANRRANRADLETAIDAEEKQAYVQACQRDQKTRELAGQSLPVLTLTRTGRFIRGRGDLIRCEHSFQATTNTIGDIANLRITIALSDEDGHTQQQILAFEPFGMNSQSNSKNVYNSSQATTLVPIYDEAFCEDLYQVKSATAMINGRQTNLLQQGLLKTVGDHPE